MSNYETRQVYSGSRIKTGYLVDLKVVRSAAVREFIGHNDHIVVGNVAVLGRRRVEDDHQLGLGDHPVERRRVQLRWRWTYDTN